MMMEKEGLSFPRFQKDDLADLIAFLHDREVQERFRAPPNMTPLGGGAVREGDGEIQVKTRHTPGINETLLKLEAEGGGEASSAETKVLAVSGTLGLDIPLRVYLMDGHGEGGLFLNIENAYYRVTLQRSVAKAYVEAMQFTGVSLGRKIVLIRIFNPYSGYTVTIEGESAGAAVAIALVAAIEGREIRPNVLITGTIENDGSIGSVESVYRKAEAAKKAGATTLLVPPGDFTSLEGLEVVEVHDLGEVEEWMLA
jgi:predicted S18 family serine protease